MQTRTVVIHLREATDRMQLIFDLEAKLGRPIEIFFAFDGTEWEAKADIAKLHPLRSGPISRGNIGCTQSHLHLLRSSYKCQEGGICIFEDDCEFTASQAEIQAYAAAAEAATGGNWDILLFGATEYVEGKPDPVDSAFFRPTRFWGTHAMIVKPKAALAVIDAFMAYQKEGLFPPADWMYSRAIQMHSLVCIGPKNPNQLCCQKEGLRSSVTGAIRKRNHKASP